MWKVIQKKLHKNQFFIWFDLVSCIKKSWRSFPPARKHAWGRVLFSVFLAVVTLNLKRQRAGLVWAKWWLPLVAALCRLSDSTLALGMVWGSPSRHKPSATPAVAILVVAGTRLDSDMTTSTCPSRTRPDSEVATDRRLARPGSRRRQSLPAIWPLNTAQVWTWASPRTRPVASTVLPRADVAFRVLTPLRRRPLARSLCLALWSGPLLRSRRVDVLGPSRSSSLPPLARHLSCNCL